MSGAERDFHSGDRVALVWPGQGMFRRTGTLVHRKRWFGQRAWLIDLDGGWFFPSKPGTWRTTVTERVMERLDGPPQRRRPMWSWASDRLLRWMVTVVILGTVLLAVDVISGAQSLVGAIVGAAANGLLITTAAAELRRRRLHDDQHGPPSGTGR